MRCRAQLLAILFSSVALLMSGCAPGQPKDQKISGVLVAAPDVNVDPEGRPSPIVLRIYQLQSIVKFNNAEFFDLYDDATAMLGADLIAFDEFTLRPGQSMDYQAEFKPSAKFVGVVAAFRDISSAQWRADVALPKKPGRLKVDLQSTAVSASFED